MVRARGRRCAPRRVVVADNPFDDGLLRDIQREVLSRHPEWVRGIALVYKRRPAVARAKAERARAGRVKCAATRRASRLGGHA